MICEGCRAGADMADEYREAARADDRSRADLGQPPMEPGPARRWLKKRLRWAMSLHCYKPRASVKLVPGCTCQCKIPELQTPGTGG